MSLTCRDIDACEGAERFPFCYDEPVSFIDYCAGCGGAIMSDNERYPVGDAKYHIHCLHRRMATFPDDVLRDLDIFPETGAVE